MSIERFVRYKPFKSGVGTVIAMHAGFIPDNELDEGIFITSLDPEVKNYPNLYPILRIRLDSSELFYDYESNDTLEMRMAKLDEDVNDIITHNSHTSSQIDQITKELTDTQLAVTEAYETTLEVERDNTSTQLGLTEVYESLLGTQANITTTQLGVENLLNRVIKLEEEIAQLKGE